MNISETIKNIRATCNNYMDPDLLAFVIDDDYYMGTNNILEMDEYGIQKADSYEKRLLKILKRRDNSSQIFCLSLEWHYFCRGVYENGIVPCHQPTDIFNHIIHQSNEDSKDSCS